jgi:hypothetical protein
VSAEPALVSHEATRSRREPAPSGTADDSERLLTGVLGVREEAGPAAAAPQRYERPLFETVPARPASRWRYRLAMALFTLTIVGFGAVAGYQYGINSQSYLRNPYNLGMFVRPADSSVAVHWNQFSFAARNAAAATLTIRESDATYTVELSRPELRNGQMLVRPHAEKANFRLELAMPDGRTVSESLSWHR